MTTPNASRCYNVTFRYNMTKRWDCQPASARTRRRGRQMARVCVLVDDIGSARI